MFLNALSTAHPLSNKPRLDGDCRFDTYFILCYPQCEDDIKMVYSGAKRGLNSVMLALWFSFLTISLVAIDVGDMSLNFMMQNWHALP